MQIPSESFEAIGYCLLSVKSINNNISICEIDVSGISDTISDSSSNVLSISDTHTDIELELSVSDIDFNIDISDIDIFDIDPVYTEDSMLHDIKIHEEKYIDEPMDFNELMDFNEFCYILSIIIEPFVFQEASCLFDIFI